MHGAIGDGTGHRQHRRLGPLGAGVGQVGLDRRFGRGIAGGGIGLGIRNPWPAAGVLDQGEPRVGAADIADQAQHLS